MGEVLIFKSFQPNFLEALHSGFLKAFGDYFVDFQPTSDQFRSRIFDKLNIHKDLSALAFDGTEVVGFILHSVNNYQGQETLYNGGTGVIPSHRRRHIAERLYEQILREIKPELNLKRIVLEVIDKNSRALKFYESLGFHFIQELKCFKLYEGSLSVAESIQINQSYEFKQEYLSYLSFSPSFMDSWPQLKTNLKNQLILDASVQEELVGHIIFSPNTGRITQFAVRNAFRKRGIGRSLLASAKKMSPSRLTLLNVPAEEQETITALEKMGFLNEVDQYEMELQL